MSHSHQMRRTGVLLRAGYEVWLCSCGELEFHPLDEAYDDETDNPTESSC